MFEIKAKQDRNIKEEPRVLCSVEAPSLHKANLRGAGLRDADLCGQDLREADLRGAYLVDADLREANLCDANLAGAWVTGARFWDADLENADLTGAQGLLPGALAGANLRGARLPDTAVRPEGLAQADAASQNAGKLLITILTVCLYGWLTIGSTTDVSLFANSSPSKLPSIGTEIPIVSVYWVGPLLLLALYFDFHLFALRLWEGIVDLPAVFPDGKPLDKRVHPWLLNGLIRLHLPRLRLREEAPSLMWLQTSLCFLLAWAVVPITLAGFWLTYLPRHDWRITTLHIATLTMALEGGVAFYRLTQRTLRGKQRTTVWRGKIGKNVARLITVFLTLKAR
jgi:hypothetical protein